MFTTRLRFLTAGESHGPSLTGILDGMPAGLPLDEATLAHELARRQHGFGAGGRMKLEQDRARITGGVLAGRTTGGPIALVIDNKDHANWADRDIAAMTIPRPGHADLTGALKYGHRDLRLSLERASARETAMRVAVGACCRALLAEFGVTIGGYVTRIGEVALPDAEPTADPATYEERFAAAAQNDVRCPDAGTAARMHDAIAAVVGDRDTLGGIVEVAALHVPPGLGSFAQGDRRLDTRLAAALAGMPAVKGVEFGLGFAGSARRGTQAHDAIELDGDDLVRPTNRAGGLEGGVSNGTPIVARIALKPIATTLQPQRSVDLAKGTAAETKYERSDFCQVPRAVPIAEAMVAIVLADALLEKLGGDSLEELRPRLFALRQARASHLPMDGGAWRFGSGA
ncbi:MAG: chorismate synthase [Planctomycetes bacterium]|nr:chorismate synthase [Planctomycetota bacterium]